MSLPPCPQCGSSYTYEDQGQFICPECGHEWRGGEPEETMAAEAEAVVRDANGNGLQVGDLVTVIKDLKIKGSSSVIKIGTRAKILRLGEGDHAIECRLDGMGVLMLKQAFVRKA